MHKVRKGISAYIQEKSGVILQNMNFSRCYRNRGKVIYGFDPNIINIKITKDFEYCTCPLITSELLKKHGLIANGSLQKIMNLTLYPSCYFAPLDFYTRQLNLTENSYSIHHYGMSWLNERDRYWHGIEARLSSKIGRYLAHIVIRVAKFPKGFVQGIITDGVHLTIHKYMNKLKNNIG